MNKISVNKEYLIDPLNRHNRFHLMRTNPNNFSVTGDLILIFGNGYACVDSKVICSKLIGVMYRE